MPPCDVNSSQKMRVTAFPFPLISSLLFPLLRGQRTLQSLTSSSPPETTTTLPWPTLTLEDFSASPTDSWSFQPHRPPNPPPSSDETYNHRTSPRVSIKAVPLMEIPSPSLGPSSSPIESLVPPRPPGPPPQHSQVPKPPNPEVPFVPTLPPVYRRYEVPPPADGAEERLEESESVEESRLVPVVKERSSPRKESSRPKKQNRPQKQPRLQLVSLPR